MDKIITDEATKQILSKVKSIRHDLELLETNPNDFKYVQLVAKWIQTDAELIQTFSETMLQWEE